MKTLTVSIFALVALAGIVATLVPGTTAQMVLALGSPFVLFANVMAYEGPRDADCTPAAPPNSALLVDCQ